jgi:hypothetical protein
VLINAESLEEELYNEIEYEEEELYEAPTYLSDIIDLYFEEDLEFNPWTNVYSPDYSKIEESNEDEGNPAIFLAEVLYKNQ